jgi:hypothetical protein
MTVGPAKTLQDHNATQFGMIVDYGHRLPALPAEDIAQKKLPDVRW